MKLQTTATFVTSINNGKFEMSRTIKSYKNGKIKFGSDWVMTLYTDHNQNPDTSVTVDGLSFLYSEIVPILLTFANTKNLDVQTTDDEVNEFLSKHITTEDFKDIVNMLYELSSLDIIPYNNHIHNAFNKIYFEW